MRKYAWCILCLMVVLASCRHIQSQVSCTTLSTSNFRGVNWADERDNYVDGWLYPSGVVAGESYTQVQAIADTVLTGFKTNLGANTVRLPINPQTVLQSWWQSYTGTIDKTTSSNMKVILACWEGAANKNGMIDDSTQFWQMWQVVVQKYAGNDAVYFEIFNEPFGYTTAQWKAICRQWLNTFPQVPRCRVLVGGISYDDDVYVMGQDSSFNGCLLSQHIYPWWGSYTTVPLWKYALIGRVDTFANRTILTEYGAPMTTGIDYSQSGSGDVNVCFMQGITQQLSTFNMGSCYWPGLRIGDSYSIQNLSNDSMITTNLSGDSLIRSAWGLH